MVGILQDEADPMVSVMKASALSARYYCWLDMKPALCFRNQSIGVLTEYCSATAIHSIAASAQGVPGCAMESVSGLLWRQVEKAPLESYADVGGLEQQVQEIKEAVELPLTHPELYEDIGIKPPKVLYWRLPPRPVSAILLAPLMHTLCLPRSLSLWMCMCAAEWSVLRVSAQDHTNIALISRAPGSAPKLPQPPFPRALALPAQGVILYGEPGTGKTLLAKAVANSTSATFLRVVGSELIQKYLGDGPKLVRELFRVADDLAPSIVFIGAPLPPSLPPSLAQPAQCTNIAPSVLPHQACVIQQSSVCASVLPCAIAVCCVRFRLLAWKVFSNDSGLLTLRSC